MAALTLLVLNRIGAGGKDWLTLEYPLSIVACTTMETFTVGTGTDAGGLRLHGKAYIHMADPAGELGAVKPMVKHDRPRSARGIVVKNHFAKVSGIRGWRRG